MPLTKSQILAAGDLPVEKLAVPEWDGEVNIRVMSGSERDRFEAAHLKDPSKDVRARLAVYALCDDDGQPLFTEADIPALGSKGAPALDRIFAAAIRLNGIGKKDVEDLAGNS